MPVSSLKGKISQTPNINLQNAHCIYDRVQVACMLEPRLKDGHFIRHAGTLAGTSLGGLGGMYASLKTLLVSNEELQPATGAQAPNETQLTGNAEICSPALTAVPEAEGAALMVADSSGQSSTQEQDASAPAQCSSASKATRSQAKQPSGREQMESAAGAVMSTLQVLRSSSTSDSTLALCAAQLRQCNLELQRFGSRKGTQGPLAQRAKPLQVNAQAPAGMSEIRLKSCLEQRRNKSKAPARPALNRESPEKPRAVPLYKELSEKPLTFKELVGKPITVGEAAKARHAALSLAAREGKPITVGEAAKARHAALSLAAREAKQAIRFGTQAYADAALTAQLSREAAAAQKRAHQLTLLPSNASAVAVAEASSALPLSMRPQLAAGQGMQELAHRQETASCSPAELAAERAEPSKKVRAKRVGKENVPEARKTSPAFAKGAGSADGMSLTEAGNAPTGKRRRVASRFLDESYDCT